MTPASPATGCHDEAARLLPWWVNGTLPPAEARAVEGHLESCATCRDDADALARLRTAMRNPGQVEHAPHAGLRKLMQRIDAAQALPQPGPAELPAMPGMPERWRAGGTLRWLTAAVVLQSVALLVLGTVAMRGPGGDDAAYRTLTAAPAAAPAASLRVVFSPALTLGELQALLQANGLRVLAGPSEAGLFSLGLNDPRAPAAERAAALARLRADPRVRFAEPLGPTP